MFAFKCVVDSTKFNCIICIICLFMVVLRSVKLFVILGFKRRNDSSDPTLVTEVMTCTQKCIKCPPMSEMLDLSFII